MKRSLLDKILYSLALIAPAIIFTYLVIDGVISLSLTGAGRAQADFGFAWKLIGLGSVLFISSGIEIVALYVTGSEIRDPKIVYLAAMALSPIALWFLFWAFW